MEQTDRTSFDAQLQCPEGCSFRVFARNIAGWRAASAASAVLATRQLPVPSRGAMRLQIEAAVNLANGAYGPPSVAIARFQRRFEAELGAALSLGDQGERVHCLELRDVPGTQARHVVVFDLLPDLEDLVLEAGNAPTMWAEPDKEVGDVARQLAAQLLTQGSSLRNSTLFAESTALMQLGEDGSMRRVRPAPSSQSSASPMQTIGKLLLLLAGGSLGYFAWRRSRETRHSYGRVAILPTEEAVALRSTEGLDERQASPSGSASEARRPFRAAPNGHRGDAAREREPLSATLPSGLPRPTFLRESDRFASKPQTAAAPKRVRL